MEMRIGARKTGEYKLMIILVVDKLRATKYKMISIFMDTKDNRPLFKLYSASSCKDPVSITIIRIQTTNYIGIS